MISRRFMGAVTLGLTTVLSAHAAMALVISVENNMIGQERTIAPNFALCKATPDGKSGPSANMRPEISWTGAPEGTKSFALFVYDPDVPADFTDAGKEGKSILKSAPRQMFYHWGIVDIPPTVTKLPGGKSEVSVHIGTPVTNDLGKYISDARNYGGPCPPWNDMRVHHYHFQVFALDVAALEPKPATAKEAWKAVQPHILTDSEMVGIYSLNPKLDAGQSH